MSGTPNPESKVIFANGGQRPLPDLADSVLLIIGPASDGPFNRPRRASQQAQVLAFKHGPLVGWGSHHAQYSQACMLQRCRASVPGSFGSVAKTPSGASPGTLSVAASSYSLHATVTSPGAALNVTAGWILPPAALPPTITSGSGTVAHSQTFQYLDEEGTTRTSSPIAISGPGSVTATFLVKKVLKVTSDVDPVGIQDYAAAFPGPQDRHDVQFKFVTGGQISGGFSQPSVSYSFDAGRTWSPSRALPSTGVVELTTYAGGFTPQATGMTATLAAGTNTVTDYGSVKVTGADANGGLIATALAAGLSIAVAVAGNNTPLSIGKSGGAYTINSATDAGGLATTTGAAALAFILTDASANAVSLRQNMRFRTTGTGAGLLAAFSSANFTNCGLVMTARQTGVLVNILETGASTARKVTRAGKTLTILLDTDSAGLRASTPNQIRDLVNNDADASRYASFAVTGTGAGLAGDTGGPVALVTSFDDGDLFAFSALPPSASNADVDEALAALAKRQDVLANISHVALAKDGADSVDFQSLHGALDALADPRRQFKRGIMQAAYMGATDEDTWATNVKAAYPQRGTKVGIVVAEADTVIPAYGTRSRRNFGILYAARHMNCPISEYASHVECDTLKGIQYELLGVGDHLVPGGDPARPEYVSLYNSEDALVDLHAQNFVTPRQHPNLTGIYVRQALNYTADGDDYVYAPNGRVADVAAALAYLETVRLLNASLLTDPDNGALAESEHQKIEKNVKDFVGSKLLSDAGRQHVVALDVVSDRSIDYAATKSVWLDLIIVPREPAVKFTTQVNVTKTLSTGGTAQG